MTGPADSAGRVEIMQRAIDRMMRGGNHLATHIDPDGPTWRDETDAGLRHYGAGLAFDCLVLLARDHAGARDAGKRRAPHPARCRAR